MFDFLTAIIVVAGGAFVFIAGLGIWRMPDLMIRMHASTKAGTLGVGLILAALAIHFGELGVVSRSIAAIVFLLLTAPVAAHMIGRAAYRSGVPLWEANVVDEYRHRWSPRPGAATDQATPEDPRRELARGDGPRPATSAGSTFPPSA